MIKFNNFYYRSMEGVPISENRMKNNLKSNKKIKKDINFFD